MNTVQRNTLRILIALAIVIYAFFAMVVIYSTPVKAELLEDVEAFLVNDTTNNSEWLPYYSCGHFARDLSRNASQFNISIGSVILGNHPTLRGHDNHIVNYVIDNNTVYLIEPQTDEIFLLNQSGYLYYRLYYNGDQVPSYRTHNLATIKIFPPVIKGIETLSQREQHIKKVTQTGDFAGFVENINKGIETTGKKAATIKGVTPIGVQASTSLRASTIKAFTSKKGGVIPLDTSGMPMKSPNKIAQDAFFGNVKASISTFFQVIRSE